MVISEWPEEEHQTTEIRRDELDILRRKAAALEDAYNLLIVLHARAAGGAATAAWAARVLDELGALFAAEEADHA